MTPYVDDPDFRLYVGDVRDVLAQLEPGSVDCCVTSPPYWGLRDYGADGQIGLESSPEEYVEQMVAVFRDVRRVLADTGTLWLNLGDSYNANGREGHGTRIGAKQGTNRASANGSDWNRPTDLALKPKDLVGIPWRVALALQADGWYLRADVIWSKPNPMPESVTDRPTKSHEYVFLLSKQPRYWFDQEAVREKYAPATVARDAYGYNHAFANQFKGSPTDERHPDGKVLPARSFAKGPDGRKETRVVGADGSIQHRDGERWPNGGRNIRSVWEIATQPYSEAHFATFPEEIPRRCIQAGCPEQVCATCGKPRERIVETESSWQSDCDHDDYRPGVVLDPFMGSGTTALVARKYGRRSVGVEINPEYAALAARRLGQQSLFA